MMNDLNEAIRRDQGTCYMECCRTIIIVVSYRNLSNFTVSKADCSSELRYDPQFFLRIANTRAGNVGDWSFHIFKG